MQHLHLCQIHPRQDECDCQRPLQSRTDPPPEWSFHQDIADIIFQQWSHPNLDLFATRFNTRCVTFVPLTPDHRALFTDALAMNWEEIFAYAFPPQQIFLQILQIFRQTNQCRLILVASFWPKQTWFVYLQRLTQEKPIPLPH